MVPGKTRIVRYPLLGARRLGVLALLGILLFAPLAPVAAAQPRAASPVWALEWTALGPGGAAGGDLAGLSRLPSARGLALAAGAADGQFESPVHDMGHDFMAAGVLWRAALPAGAKIELELRRSSDGATWEPWQGCIADESSGPDGAKADLSHSELVVGAGRYVQVRATLLRGTAASAPSLEVLKLVAIDARQGPQAAVAEVATPPGVVSRAAWGADESWMNWPPEYAPVLKFVVHHTVTSNYDADPAATVRAIYYYHAVTLDWGDIGYNYLIDRFGRIYEGRAGGDGVIGGHARPYNSGTVGVAILGDYRTTDVPSAAVSSLVELLAWKSNLHFVHPLESGWLRDATFPNIMGHRDCNPTECPGDRAYALLPQIRTRTFDRLRAIPPHLLISQPPVGDDVAGVQRVAWRASAAVTQLSVAVDGGASQALAPTAAFWPWNTTALPDGSHRLQFVASTDLGQTTAAEVSVQVDNTSPSGELLAPRYTNTPAVTLTLACVGCTAVQFGQGWRWEGEGLYHASGSGRVVSDPAAANGQAWLGRAGDSAGPWFGPYYCGLPAPGDYEAVFWLRSARNDLGPTLAELDVADQVGRRVLAGRQAVVGADFAALGRYQLFRLPFRYPDVGTSCRGGEDDGLELRTWFAATGDLWLDRVEVLTAPQPFAGTVSRVLPTAEGPHPVEARFLDRAGNASPLYTQTVILDRTPPVWGTPTVGGLPVQDALSGLDAKEAAFSLSDNGVTWSDWIPASLAMEGGSQSGIVVPQPGWTGRMVRARVRDSAGNLAVSTPASWPPGAPLPTPTPGPTPAFSSWVYCPRVTG